MSNEKKCDHILVTGGAGFIGSTLVPLLLQEGYTVTVYARYNWGVSSLLPHVPSRSLHLVKGDILDKDILSKAMANADTIIHLAAIVGYPACDRDHARAKKVNEDGTALVVQLLRPEQKLVYASSVCCYGAVEGLCTEETTIRPVTVYGKTKANGEKLVLAAGGVALRLASLFGISPHVRLDLLVNALTMQAVTVKRFDLYESHFRRCFLHVKDAARAFKLAVQNYPAMAGQAYNVGDESLNMTKADVVKRIQSFVTDCKVTMSDERDKEKRDYETSYAKIKAQGFKVTRSIDDGIRELLKVLPYFTEDEIKQFKNV